MSGLKFPEVPKDYVPPSVVQRRYWVNEKGFLTINKDENVLVDQVGVDIDLFKAAEVEQRDQALRDDVMHIACLLVSGSTDQETLVGCRASIQRLLAQLGGKA